MENSELIHAAARFAELAHASIDQRRKYTNEPYIVHPRAVAATVESVVDDPVCIAAAWLHDVVEDTPTTIDEIAERFGGDVADVVAQVTNPSKPSDGNRAVRKAIDRKHIASADFRGQTVKLADLIDNLDGISNAAPGFARKYLNEKQQQLEVLSLGHSDLRKRVQNIIQRELANLK